MRKAARGFAAPETVRAYERARQLCSQLGGTPRVIPALWGLWGYFATQGNLRRARQVGEELLESAVNIMAILGRAEPRPRPVILPDTSQRGSPSTHS